MAGFKLLVTGATGYVGGAVLTQLLESSIPEVRDLSISVAVRKQEQADLFASKGLKTHLISGIEDTASLRRLASQHDVVINATDATNGDAAEALILGLADGAGAGGAARARKHLFHLSGTSSLGDRPVSGRFVEPRSFSDKHDDVFAYLREREAAEPYVQRATDIRAAEAGERAGVAVHVVKAPRIYGRGTGWFNTKSVQIPMMIRAAVAAGRAQYIGEGAGVWDDVHVVDLADLFELLVAKVLKGEEIPAGRKGLYFAGTLRHSWKEVAESIAKIAYELGLLKSPETESVSLEEAAKAAGGWNADVMELGLASKSVTNADLALELGWKSKKGEADFQQSIREDTELLFQDRLTKA